MRLLEGVRCCVFLNSPAYRDIQKNPEKRVNRIKQTQAVSPYTETVISTTTSVCNATLTVLSPMTLMGPLGIRTWDLGTL